MPQNENKPANENKPVQKKKVSTNKPNNKKNTAANNKPPRRPKTDKPQTTRSRPEKPKTEKPKTDKPRTDKSKTERPNKPRTNRPKPDKARAERPKPDNKTTDPKKKFKKPPYKKPFNKNKDKKQNKKNGDDFSILSKPIEIKAWTIEEAERYVTAVKNAFEKIPESEDKKVDLRDIWINSSLPGDLILEIIRENYEKIGIEKENLLLDGKKILLITEQPKPVSTQTKEEKTLKA